MFGSDWGWLGWFFWIGVVLIFLALALEKVAIFNGDAVAAIGLSGTILFAVGLLLLIGMAISAARGRDLDGRFAGGPLHEWFDSLKSGKGPCCSDADGTAVKDADWESKDGHFRVFIHDQWWDVPDDALITEPNRFGRTMVWPIYGWDYSKRAPANPGGYAEDIKIRCFMPGSMS